MKRRNVLGDLLAEDHGGTVVEFAILAPAVIAMLMGILAIGMQMQSYNALRSVAADVSRYTVVEYQKENTLDEAQISDVAAAMASHPPYSLSGDRLDVSVEEQESPVDGAKKFALTMTYQPFSALQIYGMQSPTLRYTQNIFVPM
jgi:Flp pilus assembly protein TadG